MITLHVDAKDIWHLRAALGRAIDNADDEAAIAFGAHTRRGGDEFWRSVMRDALERMRVCHATLDSMLP